MRRVIILLLAVVVPAVVAGAGGGLIVRGRGFARLVKPWYSSSAYIASWNVKQWTNTTQLLDDSPAGLNYHLSNMPSVATGPISNGLYWTFDGVDDCFKARPNTYFLNGMTGITMYAIIRCRTNANTLVEQGIAGFFGSYYKRVFALVNGPQVGTLRAYVGDGSNYTSLGWAAMRTNVWWHCAITYRLGDVARFWVNATNVVNGTVVGPIVQDGVFQIGKVDNWNYFDGDVASVEILSNVCSSAGDITSHFQSTMSGGLPAR